MEVCEEEVTGDGTVASQAFLSLYDLLAVAVFSAGTAVPQELGASIRVTREVGEKLQEFWETWCWTTGKGRTTNNSLSREAS